MSNISVSCSRVTSFLYKKYKRCSLSFFTHYLVSNPLFFITSFQGREYACHISSSFDESILVSLRSPRKEKLSLVMVKNLSHLCFTTFTEVKLNIFFMFREFKKEEKKKTSKVPFRKSSLEPENVENNIKENLLAMFN